MCDTFNGTTFLCPNLSLTPHAPRPFILVLYRCPLIMNPASKAVWSSPNPSHSKIALVSNNVHDRTPRTSSRYLRSRMIQNLSGNSFYKTRCSILYMFTVDRRLSSAWRNSGNPHDSSQSRERASFNLEFSAVGKMGFSDGSSCDDLRRRVREVSYVQDPIL